MGSPFVDEGEYIHGTACKTKLLLFVVLDVKKNRQPESKPIKQVGEKFTAVTVLENAQIAQWC